MTDSDTSIPRQKAASDVDTIVSMQELWLILWSHKKIIVGFSLIFGLLALIYAFVATEWYRSETLLASAKNSNSPDMMSRLGGLGGLAGLAGINIGDEGNAEAIAILKSRDFARRFIEENDLLTIILHEEWDEDQNAWQSLDPDDQPDIRDAVKFFHDEVQHVSEDQATSLVTLRVDWIDADLAAAWANMLVTRLNAHTRARAMEDAKRNVEYLRSQLQATDITTLRESISTLLESELQKLMLANGNIEYSFRVIDSAQVAKKPIRPQRALTILITLVVGCVFGILFAFIYEAFLVQRRSS